MFCVHGASCYPTRLLILFFFFNDTATTEIYTLSLHDALPIYDRRDAPVAADERDHFAQTRPDRGRGRPRHVARQPHRDRKSTRLNSSHSQISYAVFCLKKKKLNAMSVHARSHHPPRQLHREVS